MASMTPADSTEETEPPSPVASRGSPPVVPPLRLPPTAATAATATAAAAPGLSLPATAAAAALLTIPPRLSLLHIQARHATQAHL
jgi:hypothetical protein